MVARKKTCITELALFYTLFLFLPIMTSLISSYTDVHSMHVFLLINSSVCFLIPSIIIGGVHAQREKRTNQEEVGV